MKRLSRLLAAVAALLSFYAISAPAEAHGRVRGGVFLNFGVPWPGYYWGPRYYYGPPARYYYDDDYYVPPAVVIPREPPQYVERSDIEGTPPATQDQAQQNWWYWCAASRKYFPYVKECAGGFQRVPPQPVPPANR